VKFSIVTHRSADSTAASSASQSPAGGLSEDILSPTSTASAASATGSGSGSGDRLVDAEEAARTLHARQLRTLRNLLNDSMRMQRTLTRFLASDWKLRNLYELIAYYRANRQLRT
jgi:hypothetical protein